MSLLLYSIVLGSHDILPVVAVNFKSSSLFLELHLYYHPPYRTTCIALRHLDELELLLDDIFRRLERRVVEIAGFWPWMD